MTRIQRQYVRVLIVWVGRARGALRFQELFLVSTRSTGRSSASISIWIVWDGLRLTKRSHELEGYFLGGRSLPWWAVGLSVMATQLSAITMIGTTGQGYADGMRFLQFYFALPLAMIILSVTLVPFFHNAKVYTAYEYLERRFDAKTRAFTSLLFLMSRSMSLGVVISAPAVVLSVVLGTDRHDDRAADRRCRRSSTRCSAACRR